MDRFGHPHAHASADARSERRRALARAFLVALLAASTSVWPRPAGAGCGCDKPPPPPAQVRPNVTYAGSEVMLFASGLVQGTPYTITFTSGVTGVQQSVNTQVVVRRDLGDGVAKPLIAVPLPVLPLGPASITAQRTGMAVVDLMIDDSQFTVAPTPVALPTAYGGWHYPGYQAAVGRDGVVYASLDLTGLTKPMVFEAQAAGYALRFRAQDILFKNAQGFLMQMLVQGAPDALQPVPGMFVFPAINPGADSDLLHYSRHEFATYFLQHAERQPHAVDPTDGNWHMDGSRHVDHNHLILAIMGRMNDGSAPAAGATPAFDLVLKANSLFYQGLVGKSSVTMKNGSKADAFTAAGTIIAGGDVFSNGPVSVLDSAILKGDATGASVRTTTYAKVTGAMLPLPYPQTFMEVKLPTGLPNLGSINMGSTNLVSGLLTGLLGGASSQTATITGPGSFQIGDIVLRDGARLYIDNSRGPVTLYLTGTLSLGDEALIKVANPDPEQFAVYVTSQQPVSLTSDATFYGVLYAPTSNLLVAGSAGFYGAFVGDNVTTKDSARIHYYRPLRGN